MILMTSPQLFSDMLLLLLLLLLNVKMQNVFYDGDRIQLYSIKSIISMESPHKIWNPNVCLCVFVCVCGLSGKTHIMETK